MDPKEIQRTLIAFALAGGALPFERMLFAPEDDASGGGGGGKTGEGGNTQQGPPADAPKYTDKQLNDLIAKNNAKLEAKLKAEAEAAAKALRDELEAAKNEAALAGKSAEEKAKLIAESDAKKRAAEAERVAKDLADTKARAESAEARLRDYQVTQAASTALVEAKVLSGATVAATKLFKLDAKVDIDDQSGAVTGVTLDGVFHKTMKEAAEAFLKANPHFQSAPAGGSGTPRTGSAPGPARKSSDLSVGEAWELAVTKPAQ